MAEGDRPYEGTEIGPDGKRYPLGEVPESALPPGPKMLAQIHGTPTAGDVVWWNPDRNRLEFADLDTVSAYVPSGS